MCTLTYIPLNSGSYYFTSNRDESPERPTADFPQWISAGNQKILTPRDPEGGGSWIAVSENGRAACLLNGAFEKHDRKESYRISRGQVLLDLFKYSKFEDFLKNYALTGIEPFTIVFTDRYPELYLQEMKWDGNKLHLATYDTSQPHIWSSVTLYDPELIKKRHERFYNWLGNQKKITAEAIRDFHHFGAEENNPVPIRLYKGDAAYTLSVTNISMRNSEVFMHYDDLLQQKDKSYSFRLKE